MHTAHQAENGWNNFTAGSGTSAQLTANKVDSGGTIICFRLFSKGD
jgi:hypothetical protein